MKDSLGKKGEDIAVRYLKKKGLKILKRNWHTPTAEADIIALDGDTLVFVEVKARTRSTHGSGVQHVGKTKQKKVIQAALVYLQRIKGSQPPVRFDVIGILYKEDSPEIEHIESAFESTVGY